MNQLERKDSDDHDTAHSSQYQAGVPWAGNLETICESGGYERVKFA
jgi:hypothetical protein